LTSSTADGAWSGSISHWIITPARSA
jgi:hypothetical protein